MTIKELLVELVKIPSVSSDIKQLRKIVNFVENYFKDTKAIIERYEFNQKPSIVIKNFEWKHADIILNWHLDVVPPSEEWQFDPYEKDGKLYGRWAGDMKSWDAIIMKLMKDLLNQNFKEKKIALILTTDEEVGGFDGVNKIVNEVWYSGDIVLIPDSGSFNKIVYAEKWILHLHLKFTWLSCHASRPWLWINAIENMFKFYQLLKNYIVDDRKLYAKEDHWGSSVSLNVVKWWVATNVLPDYAEAKIDIRFTEEFTLSRIQEVVKLFLAQTNWEIINEIYWHVLYTNPSHPIVQKYLSVAKKYNDSVFLSKAHWGSDWRFFAKKWSVVLL